MSRCERRVAARGSQSPAELYPAGLHHMQAGRHLEAQLCCKQALAADPDHADILHLIDLCDSLQPNQALTLQARALTFRGLRRFEQSLADNLRSYEIDPNIIETRNKLHTSDS